METKDIIFVAVMLLILAEVTVILARMPRTSLSRKGRAILVDTSVLIDGRIVGIARSGFISDTLVVPRSVIGELQFLADNADADKRSRARYGLDVVAELQELANIEVKIHQDGSKAEEGVDERLLTLAKQYSAALCTIDFNLIKVALVEGITVLNINELAQGLRMARLPGETMLLELVQKGQDNHQAVGYLSDGTMVVVEQASSQLGQTVEVEVIRSLQTAAGKMMFAKLVAKKQPATGRKPVQKQTSKQSAVSTQKVPEAPQTANKRNNNARNSNYKPNRPQNQVKSSPTQANKQPRRQQQRKRIDREDALIALVDKQ